MFEVLLITVFTVVSKAYWGTGGHIGIADGKGYYEYLPSYFIHKDLVRKNWDESDRQKFVRIDNNSGIYVKADGKTINKYPVGSAILEAPFFFGAYLLTERDDSPEDGYQETFQTAVFSAAIFYLFLSLMLLKLVLKDYQISPFVIAVVQVLLAFSTSLSIYTNTEAGFSHIYSLVTVLFFLYTVRKYFGTPTRRGLIIAFGLLGLIMLLRQVNPIVVFFVPFLAGSSERLLSGVRFAFKAWKTLLVALFLFGIIVSFQFYMWYLQTGYWIVYSYQGESFNFAHPEFFNILFSYRKGLFVYTPILLFGVLGTVFYLKSAKYEFFTWWLGFIGITYILSSWWSWYYGCSYGNRAFIEFYPLFFIPLGYFLEKAGKWKFLVIPILSLTIPLNLIQTVQYNRYILHWIDMDKEKYWKVFLHTEPVYQGLVWKENKELSSFKKIRMYLLGDYEMKENGGLVIDDFQVEDRNRPTVLSVSFSNQFDANDESKIIIDIKEEGQSEWLFWSETPLIYFHENKLNHYQKGRLDLEIPPLQCNGKLQLNFYVTVGGQTSPLKDIEVSVYQ